jgi:16S rRNA (uracil1498-N3)-methyltransferase
MRQLVVDGVLRAGQPLLVTGDDYHYLARVRRIATGDTVRLMDAAGSRWEARVGTITDESLEVVPLAAAEEPADDPVFVTVYQAIPKGRRFDDAIRLLVQAGAGRIVPILTERTVVPQEATAKRSDRWERVAREAMQQSGAERPVEIGAAMPLSALRAASGAESLFLHTRPLAQHTLHRYLGRAPGAVEIVVGPEGGFSDSETSVLQEAGFNPLWLGRRVLRSENAAFFAVAAVRMLMLERDDWQPSIST